MYSVPQILGETLCTCGDSMENVTYPWNYENSVPIIWQTIIYILTYMHG